MLPAPADPFQLSRARAQVVLNLGAERSVQIGNGARLAGVELLPARNLAEPISQPLLRLRVGQAAVFTPALDTRLAGSRIECRHVVLNVPATISLHLLKQAARSTPSTRLLCAEFFRHEPPPFSLCEQQRWPLPPFGRVSGADGASLPLPPPVHPGYQVAA